MKITCQSCQSKYTVSDERVQGKTVKIKCRKCGATILVNSGGVTTTGAGATEPDSLPGSAEGGQTFLVNVAEGDQRSMSLPEIIAAYNSAVITAETYVWADGMGDWQPLGQVESIVAALNNPALVGAGALALGAPVAEMPAQDFAPAYAEAAAPEAAPEPAAPRAAARRDPTRRAPDLFGSGVGQQAVEEVATSAPVFNGSPPGPPPARAAGQRDENSMLFSLSALTAKVGPSPTASVAKPGSPPDDSGLIDLKALSNATPAPISAAADFLGDHAGLFPFGAPSAAPIAAAPVDTRTVPPPAASKTPLFIGIGIAVAAIAIVGAFFAMKGGEKPVTADTTQVAAPPPPVATPTEPAPAPPPTATAEASATATAVAKQPPRGPAKGGGAPPKAGGGTPAPATATPATPPPPKKGGCGCAPGDLMCAMKCSAK